MTAIPEVLDALTQLWKTDARVQAAGIRPDQILDGPPVTYLYSEGVAIGASREENSVEFFRSPTGLEGQDERFSVNCITWAGSGDTTFKPLRDRCDVVLTALDDALAADRSLDGVTSNAWLIGGSITQEQTGSGALVLVEFTIQATQY